MQSYLVLSFFGLNFVWLKTSKQDRRVVVVLSGENSITWTCSQKIQISCNKPWWQMNLRERRKKSEIWLWHRRLGHTSFGYLKKLFLNLQLYSSIHNITLSNQFLRVHQEWCKWDWWMVQWCRCDAAWSSQGSSHLPEQTGAHKREEKTICGL